MQGYHFQTLMILLCNICNGLSASMLSPFVDNIVMYYGKTDSRNTTGYYAGALISGVMIGRTIAATFWGWASDRFGRKPCVIFNLVAIIVISTTFAFTTNYWVALTCRFCIGLVSCISICMRASATELTPPEFHAQANLYFTTGFNIGAVLGAAIGGFFVGITFGLPLLENYPFAMPSLVLSGFALLLLIIVLPFFKESLNQSNRKQAKESTYEAYCSLFKNSAVMSYIGLMFFSSLINGFVSSVNPSWCWAEEEVGGLNFSTPDIGKLLFVTNISAIVMQNVFYKPLLKRIGLIATVKLSAWVFLPNVTLMPFMTLLGPLRVPALVIGLLCNNICVFQINTAVFLMTGEAVEKENRGKVNAMIQMSNSIARMMAPVISGSLFAWSLTVNVFPIDYHLVFIIDGFISLWLIRQTYIAERHLRNKKEPLLGSSIELNATRA